MTIAGVLHTLSRSAANFSTLFDTISSSLLCGFCSICRYKLICSVINTEILRYFRLIFVPNVMKRNRKQPSAHDQMSASSVCWDCSWTESWNKNKLSQSIGMHLCVWLGLNCLVTMRLLTFNHSTLKNANRRSVKINAADTMTSTERCGPRLFKYDLTLSHVLILRTLFRRKCGTSDLRARRDDVKWENNFAYRNLMNKERKRISICGCRNLI